MYSFVKENENVKIMSDNSLVCEITPTLENGVCHVKFLSVNGNIYLSTLHDIGTFLKKDLNADRVVFGELPVMRDFDEYAKKQDATKLKKLIIPSRR